MAAIIRSRSQAEKLASVIKGDEGSSMETARRDVLLGTITWWGFHGLLVWLGVSHFLNAQGTSGQILLSDLFAGILIGACILSLLRLTVGRILLRAAALVGIALALLPMWQGKFEWGNLTDIAIWTYTFFSFGPMSWRHALYTPLGVFEKMKTEKQ